MRQLTRRRTKESSVTNADELWSDDTELVGLVLELSPQAADTLYAQYAVGLHAWFLDQVRQLDPELSAYLHDGESEKAFTISRLEGPLQTSGRQLRLLTDASYRWYVTALSKPVVQWLAKWVKQLPSAIDLRNAPLNIRGRDISLAPKTYAQLFLPQPKSTITLSFVTPTSFRRKGYHLPLPWPVNVFHSYLRRWNDFSGMPFNQEEFLAWVDETAIIHRHQLESVKVAAGKKGSVTGFTGAVEFGLARSAAETSQFEQLFYALGQLAPYCGTGHKTTFGLGQTRMGWFSEDVTVHATERVQAERIAELTEILMSKQKRTGGDRATAVCETRATILARREFGESLQAIALDLEMPYETVKTYAKLARRELNKD